MDLAAPSEANDVMSKMKISAGLSREAKEGTVSGWINAFVP